MSARGPATHRWAWILLLAALWLLRVPSLAQPMASDQGLYAYAGQRLLAGDAPYAGAWDQKPPGIHVVYGVLWRIWPDESVVAAADLVAAALVAWWLVIIARRRADLPVGYVAAAAFLLFGNPALTQRLGGVFVRGQCETFIALAVTGAMALASHHRRSRGHLIAIGLLLGAVFWLKYNAATYGLPVLAALIFWRPTGDLRGWITELRTVVVTGAAAIVVPLLALTAAGALTDLYLATLLYNAAYSGETYGGLSGVLHYAASFPIERARNDAVWFAGGTGVLAALWFRWRAAADVAPATLWVALAWLAAAWLSILVNGGRDLPQYFVQAAPALALAAGLGLVPLGRRASGRHAGLAWLLAAAVVYGAHRASGFEDLGSSLRRDWQALTGATTRSAYLSDFGGRPQDKFVASSIAALVDDLRATTAPDQTIYVFGFSPGVPVLAGRRSASRFHWSRPITIEFAADHPGYGSAGLLADLEHQTPAVIALQYDTWGAPRGEHSADVFHGTPVLEAFLTAHYRRTADIGRFEVWRLRP